MKTPPQNVIPENVSSKYHKIIRQYFYFPVSVFGFSLNRHELNEG